MKLHPWGHHQLDLKAYSDWKKLVQFQGCGRLEQVAAAAAAAGGRYLYSSCSRGDGKLQPTDRHGHQEMHVLYQIVNTNIRI